MKKNHSVILCIFMLVQVIFFSSVCYALKVKGVNFPETVTINDKSCKLTGVGIRKKFIINVYLGALYMSQPTQSASEVISSELVKRIYMHFLYSEVRADQLVEAWNEGFEKNAGNAVTALKDKINRFNGFFNEPMKKGETMQLTYIPGKGTEVIIKGKVKGVIEGSDFMKALFSIWFGPFPPSKGLKKGMLGK